MSPDYDESLIDELEEQIRAHYAGILIGIDPDQAPGQTMSEVLRAFVDWRRRQIPAEPRAVHRSAELISSEKAIEHAKLLDGLIAKIVAGDDLTGHLSRSAPTLGKHDGLLSDWGIQHLHFLPEGRMDDLVFGVFVPSHAYLIGIYPHGSWGLQELAEIVIRNWPEQEIFIASSTAVGLTQQISDDDRAALRAAHVATPGIEYRGRVYFARSLGQMGAGSSSIAAREAMRFIAGLNDLRWNLKERMAAVQEAGERAAGRELGHDWQPALHDGKYGFAQDGVFVASAALV